MNKDAYEMPITESTALTYPRLDLVTARHTALSPNPEFFASVIGRILQTRAAGAKNTDRETDGRTDRLLYNTAGEANRVCCCPASLCGNQFTSRTAQRRSVCCHRRATLAIIITRYMSNDKAATSRSCRL